MAAGVRRIEAVTGAQALEKFHLMQEAMTAMGELFNNAKDLQGAVKKALDDNASLKKEVEAYMKEKADAFRTKVVEEAQLVNGVRVVRAITKIPADLVKDMVFKLNNDSSESLLCVIGSVTDNKPTLTVMLSKDLVNEHGLNAGKMVREAAKLIKGGGGGAPHFATAGGKNPDGLNAAIDKVVELANL